MKGLYIKYKLEGLDTVSLVVSEVYVQTVIVEDKLENRPFVYTLAGHEVALGDIDEVSKTRITLPDIVYCAKVNWVHSRKGKIYSVDVYHKDINALRKLCEGYDYEVITVRTELVDDYFNLIDYNGEVNTVLKATHANEEAFRILEGSSLKGEL